MVRRCISVVRVGQGRMHREATPVVCRFAARREDLHDGENIGSPLNDIYPNFICSITPDGIDHALGNEYA